MRLCNELEGLLDGVRADGIIVPEEAARIAAWLQKNEEFGDVHPFSDAEGHVQNFCAPLKSGDWMIFVSASCVSLRLLRTPATARSTDSSRSAFPDSRSSSVE